MDRLGVVETRTGDGFLVVKPFTRNVLHLVNSSVYDEEYRKIGKVVDVIGNTSDPRIVVKLDRHDISPSPILYYHVERTGKTRRGRR